jgi:hypothetical protein
MSATQSIDLAKFTALSGLELCHYMEPLVADPATRVSGKALEQMLLELDNYDEYHVVYAITLGAKFSPATFASRLPRFLAHEQPSVWSTALNSLDHLPDDYVTPELVDSVRKVHFASPGKAWVAEILGKLEKRLGERRVLPAGPNSDSQG